MERDGFMLDIDEHMTDRPGQCLVCIYSDQIAELGCLVCFH